MNQPGEQPEHGRPEFSSAHLAEELEQSQEQRPTTEFEFAFCEHFTLDNATLVARTLGDCDVVAIELVGGSAEKREKSEQTMSEFVQRAAAGENVDELQFLIEDKNEFIRHLLTKLASYGPKRIVLIDAGDADTEIMGAIQKWEDAKAEYLAAAPKDLSTEELQTAIRKYLQALADRDGPREALQATQLQKLARPEIGEPPRKVGVVDGLEHTPTKDHLDQLDYITSQRQIDVLSPGFLAQDIPRSFSSRASVFLRSHPGESLPSELVNRVILERYYGRSDVITNDLRSPDRHVSRDDLYAQADYRTIRLVEVMDDASVNSLLQKLEHLYRTEYEEEPWIIDDALKENYDLYRDRLPRIRGGYT
jgi:hypothetical protein